MGKEDVIKINSFTDIIRTNFRVEEFKKVVDSDSSIVLTIVLSLLWAQTFPSTVLSKKRVQYN